MAARKVLTLSPNGSPSLAHTHATGYDPTAHGLLIGADADRRADALPAPERLAEPLQSLAAVCALCNNAHLRYTEPATAVGATVAGLVLEGAVQIRPRI